MLPADKNLKQTDAESGKAEGLLCRKTGRYVDAEHPRCQAPAEPCKYRSECIIYVMEEDEKVSRSEPDRMSFKGYGIVSCGVMRLELERLQQDGFLDADKIFYCAPGLHEWPWKLEEQLPRRLKAAREASEKIIVVYGEKCFMDLHDPLRMTDALIRETCPEAMRVEATKCVDMLASAEERERISGGQKVYWLTPGWLKHWDFMFKDWDVGLANETFPQHDKAVVLDALGYFDELMEKSPEAILKISDWMKLSIESVTVSLERFRSLVAAEVSAATS